MFDFKEPTVISIYWKSDLMKLKLGPMYVLAVLLMGVIYVVGNNIGIHAGAGSNTNRTFTGIVMTDVVGVGDTIKVYYTGTLTDGTQFDSNIGKQPLQFKVGSGELIKGFDSGVIGMRLNEEKTVTIPPVEAYGAKRQDLIVQVSRDTFGNQTVRTGMSVVQSSNGQQLQGVVTSVNETNVTLDFNMPLAGQTLIFNITVVDIQKAK